MGASSSESHKIIIIIIITVMGTISRFSSNSDAFVLYHRRRMIFIKLFIHLYDHDPLTTISNEEIFPQANASKFLENLEEMFLQYYIFK